MSFVFVRASVCRLDCIYVPSIVLVFVVQEILNVQKTNSHRGVRQVLLSFLHLSNVASSNYSQNLIDQHAFVISLELTLS